MLIPILHTLVMIPVFCKIFGAINPKNFQGVVFYIGTGLYIDLAGRILGAFMRGLLFG